MPGFEKVRKNLEAHGFDVTCFDTAAEAADYLDRRLDGKTVGHGGSITLKELGLLERLQSPRRGAQPLAGGQLRRRSRPAPVYLTSVNALAETGELINIDGTGNRVASTIFGHEEVYFIVGINKLAPTTTPPCGGRNVASPKNARRLGKKTPCAVRGDKCYDCKSPERICRALAVLWERPTGIGRAEVVLVNEPLGY